MPINILLRKANKTKLTKIGLLKVFYEYSQKHFKINFKENLLESIFSQRQNLKLSLLCVLYKFKVGNNNNNKWLALSL